MMEVCLEMMVGKTREHWRNDCMTSDWPWYTGTHGKDGPGTILYEESLKDWSSRRDNGNSRNATMA
jgi:hypothetical protein